ncbi:hypothetical protein BH09BAC5_BH09BAC5_19030 [soil metagenome]
METMQTITGISAFVSLLTLIIFFTMAANISRIKKLIEFNQPKQNLKYIDIYNEGELKEYLGKNQEALDCFSEAYFLISKIMKSNPNTHEGTKHKEMIVSKIKSLGGSIKEIIA